VRRLQHLLTEATSQKSNLHPSQGEEECAACLLMIKHYLKDTCSDCLHILKYNIYIIHVYIFYLYSIHIHKVFREDALSDELDGGFKYVLFSPLLGEMIQFD